MPARAQRVVIIGGGHNGLIAAYYLAKAGFTPLVLEQRNIVGGLSVTEEIHPGFRCPTLAHTVGPLLPRIVDDLRLRKHGLEWITPDIRLTVLHPEGRAIRIYDDPQKTAEGLRGVSPHDAEAYPEFHATFAKLGRALAPLLEMTPPDIDELKMDDYFNLTKLGLNFRGLGKKDAYRLLRWGPMAVADLAAEWFQNELMRAAVEARGIWGLSAGPRSAGTSAGLLIQAALDGHALGSAAFIKGGPGALAEALRKAASDAGAEVRTGAQVARIHTRRDRVSSVVLANGEEIPAAAVVSSVDPRQTFLKLMEADSLDPGFITRVRNYRSRGVVAKVNLALSGLPAFVACAARVHIGPDTDYLERAFDAGKYGDFSPEPYLDVTIPSLVDSSLAPKGAHVMSIHVQYAPYALKSGDWNLRREELGDGVIKALSAYAPNLPGLIVRRQILTPLDLEEKLGLSGGHMFHGEHSLDQLFAFRPLLGWARYRTPIPGLYLCGGGTHPGGGITGAPAANASREIVKVLRNAKTQSPRSHEGARIKNP